MKNDRETKTAAAAKKGLTGKFLPYEKPRLESVRLFADEVLGGGCAKSDTSCITYPLAGPIAS